jgi:hypothetical protein
MQVIAAETRIEQKGLAAMSFCKCIVRLFSSALVCAALPIALSGCGSSQTTSSVTSGGGGVVRKANTYKAQDAQLIERANNITVYSTPDTVRRVMHRQPDQTVDEANGVVTQYYNSDDSPTAERLRLRYANGHLIGKEIMPPDVNASANGPSVYGANTTAAFNADFNSKLNASNTSNRRQ